MAHIEDIPRDPPGAFRHLLTLLQNKVAEMPQNHKLSTQEHTELTTLMRMLERTIPRLQNSEDYSHALKACRNDTNARSSHNLHISLANLEKLFIAGLFDDHFLDVEDEQNFNTVDWQNSDRDEVLDILTNAKNITTFSQEISEEHKRRISYWIDKAVSETLKAKSKWATMLGAFEEAMEAIGRSGPKGEPILKLIKAARTSTKRNVHIHQIEASEEPKKLPKPDDASD